MNRSLWTRLLWPALGIGLLAVVALQARAASNPSGRAAIAPPTASDGSKTRVAAEGRVVAYPGAQVVVGTDLAGTLVIMRVQEKQPVRRGELLAELRSDDHRAAVNEARAQVGEADAEIRLAEANVERARALWEKEVGSKQALDQAERDVQTARARRETARATAERLSAVLAKTRILSPIDGVVIARRAE
ncbi:MAG: efflux RND transporter periplasmic adaptor subunit, partial [Syntrophomonadaceae bacterium]